MEQVALDTANDSASKKQKLLAGCCNGSNGEAASDETMFENIFHELKEDLLTAGLADKQTADAFNRYKTVNENNVPHGKRNRGLTVVHSYRYIAGEAVTEEGLKLAAVIGWCIEWFQAYFLVADDIMDSSITRRGQPCWYKRPGVGLIAINDAYHLGSAIYEILRKYLRTKPYYVDILELFHEATHQTVTGQTLDLITAPTDHVDFTNFTLERYEAIVKYKTAFYSFYLPVASAMYMNGIIDETLYNNTKTILLKMGEFFQIQDDYLDCYGDPSVTGKIGTDIEDNKCSWLIVQALSKATSTQRATLEANYSRKEAVHVAKVREVFAELDLETVYHEYEKHSYAELTRLIDEFSGALPRDMFTAYARKIYKRQK
jgi:farnesyl diphosphate synthase